MSDKKGLLGFFSGKKLNLPSVSGVEQKTKIRIAFYVLIVVVVMVAVASGVVNKTEPRKRTVKPAFTDTTPTPISSEKLTIAGLQKEMDRVTREMSQTLEANERQQQSMTRQLERELKRSRDEAERTKKELKDMEKRLKEAESAQKRAQSQATPTVTLQAKGGDDPYIMPPLPDVKERPVIERPSTTPSVQMPVPPNAAPVAPVEPAKQPWTALPNSTVLNGGEDVDGNVITGKKTEQSSKKTGTVGTFLPMGSFTNVALMTGADFGAGRSTRSNPQPTLLRIMSDAVMPNDGRYKLKHCSAMGSGYGEMSSERVYITVTRLSCVDVNTGRTLETPVIGYIADSDGKLGMRGKLVNREGAVMAKAILAGFAEGLGDMLGDHARNVQSTVTGSGVVQTMDTENATEAGLYGGASRAMEMLAKEYLEQAKNIFPVIEVDSGRKAAIIIQEGQQLVWREPTGEEKS